VGAEPAGELLDRVNALLAAGFDDVGGAVLAGQALSRLVAAHGDDLLGSELPGGEHGEQPDGTVADDGDRLSGAGFGGHGSEPAGAEDIGGRQQARDQLVGGQVGVATSVPSASGTRSNSAWAPSAPMATRFTQPLW
jgi:hypothetical protein